MTRLTPAERPRCQLCVAISRHHVHPSSVRRWFKGAPEDRAFTPRNRLRVLHFAHPHPTKDVYRRRQDEPPC